SYLSRTARLSLDAHNRDLLEALFERGRLQSLSHLLHDFIGDSAVALAVPLHAYGQRHVKEDGLHLVAEALRHANPLTALVWREVRGIDVVPGHLGDQPRSQKAAQRGENQSLVALLRNVVKKNRAQQVAREWRDAAAL